MKKGKRRIIELAEKYGGSAAPPCPHFGSCGGCLFQDIDYSNQLLLKREHLAELLDGVIEPDAVQASTPYRYRNRMDFVAAFGVVGLRRRGSHRHAVDIQSCDLIQEKSNDVYKRLRPLLEGVEDYNYLIHKGYLRYVVLRQGRFTGSLMLNLVVSSRENRLAAVIDSIADRVDSLSLILNDGMADVSFGEVFETIKGGAIEERLDGVRFTIAPNSFFQSNSEIALSMYRRIREEARGSVLDLYSGVGSISLFIAGGVERVSGVESSDEAVAAAVENARLNGIENARFICADALQYLRENTERFTTIILDPPRSGLNPRMMKHLAALSPEIIIYMSCNPASFKNDAALLEGYRIDRFEAFDMFPQTPHVETLAVMRRTG